jgi:hypothetical protein
MDLSGHNRNDDKKFIVSNDRFLSIVNHGGNDIALEGYDQIPHDTGSNHIIALGGFEFNIKKAIYPTATIKEIFDGWNELIAQEIPMDLLFLSLFISEVLDASSSESKAVKHQEVPQLY